MFFVGEVVKPSGKGKNRDVEGMVGTVTLVENASSINSSSTALSHCHLTNTDFPSTRVTVPTIPSHVAVLPFPDGLTTSPTKNM